MVFLGTYCFLLKFRMFSVRSAYTYSQLRAVMEIPSWFLYIPANLTDNTMFGLFFPGAFSVHYVCLGCQLRYCAIRLPEHILCSTILHYVEEAFPTARERGVAGNMEKSRKEIKSVGTPGVMGFSS